MIAQADRTTPVKNRPFETSSAPHEHRQSLLLNFSLSSRPQIGHFITRLTIS